MGTVVPDADMSPSEVSDRLTTGSDGWVLLDCRELVELSLARIDGAVHIPMGEIPDRLAELDATRETVVFCHHGIRSAQVAAFLRQQGFACVRNMAGGIDAWSTQVDPSTPRYR